MQKSVLITDIQHFSIHDGPGIRTTVFLKGCPLSCRWCHNPEAIESNQSLFFHENLCTVCGDCIPICTEGCFEIQDSTLSFSRESCTLCGLCVDSCHHGALELKGKTVTISDIVEECLLDKKFYKETGGVTLSGGEPLFRQDAIFELMEKLKEEDIHLVLDTSGAVQFSLLEKAAQFIDLFYYDCKCFDSNLHKKWTGVTNDLILDNLIRLLKADASVVVRIPVIPGFNDNAEEMGNIAEHLKSFADKIMVNLLPYHHLGSNKYHALGMKYQLGTLERPNDKTIKELESAFNVSEIPVRSFYT